MKISNKNKNEFNMIS